MITALAKGLQAEGDTRTLDQRRADVFLLRRDVDYVVKDGEVLIVNEFTGRLMPGRR